MNSSVLSFQEMITRLQNYWADQGCLLIQPLDMQVGAGTFAPATFLKALGPTPWWAAYTQAVRRPADSRYGEHPNRGAHYYQFQVILKPYPVDLQARYIRSLEILGINFQKAELRFVEDNWESPTLGAVGLGWEVWLNGMEVSQYTYFQEVAGQTCNPITGELTYGLERLAMCLQNQDNMYDLVWGHTPVQGPVTYGDLFQQHEQELSAYYFDHADTEHLRAQFKNTEAEVKKLLDKHLPRAAYESVIAASHLFNVLDARGAITPSARESTLLRVRKLATAVATAYLEGESYARDR